LDLRQRSGEKFRPEGPLIRKEYDRTDPMSVSYPKPIRVRSYDSIIQDMLEQAGVTRIEPSIEGKRQYRKPVARTTGFGRMVNTTMVRCKLDPLIKEMLLGHHTGLEENYYRPEDQDLLEQDLRCVDALTVNQENKLRREIQTLRVERSNWEAMRMELDDIKSLLNCG
jgi:hypothetical protein